MEFLAKHHEVIDFVIGVATLALVVYVAVTCRRLPGIKNPGSIRPGSN